MLTTSWWPLYLPKQETRGTNNIPPHKPMKGHAATWRRVRAKHKRRTRKWSTEVPSATASAQIMVRSGKLMPKGRPAPRGSSMLSQCKARKASGLEKCHDTTWHAQTKGRAGWKEKGGWKKPNQNATLWTTSKEHKHFWRLDGEFYLWNARTQNCWFKEQTLSLNWEKKIKDLLQWDPIILRRQHLSFQDLAALVQIDEFIKLQACWFFMDHLQKCIELSQGVRELLNFLHWNRTTKAMWESLILLHLLNLAPNLLNP